VLPLPLPLAFLQLVLRELAGSVRVHGHGMAAAIDELGPTHPLLRENDHMVIPVGTRGWKDSVHTTQCVMTNMGGTRNEDERVCKGCRGVYKRDKGA
jgi:hypothetical protein